MLSIRCLKEMLKGGRIEKTAQSWVNYTEMAALSLKFLRATEKNDMVHVPNFEGVAGSEDFAFATLPTTPIDFQSKI